MMRKTKSTLKQCAALVSSLSVLALLLCLFVFLRADTDEEEEPGEEYAKITLASLEDVRRAVDISSIFWDYSAPFVYDGNVHTVKLCGIPEGIEVVYADNSFTDAGYYLAKYELLYDKSKIYTVGAPPSPLEWQIERAAADISGITAPDKTVEYDGGSHNIEIITGGGDGIVPIIPDGETEVGEYELTVSFKEDKNYVPISPIVRRLIITQRQPTLSEGGFSESFLADVIKEALGGSLLIVNIAAAAAIISLGLLLAFAFIDKKDKERIGEEENTGRDFDELNEGIELGCDRICTKRIKSGALYIRYRTTFTARLIRAGEETQEKYGKLKNHILSYVGVKSRISDRYETFNKGKQLLAKINIKGKTVILSLALSPEEFGGKYKLEPPSASDIESGLHLSIKVKGSRTSSYALTLIDTLMSINNIAAGTPMSVDYKMPYEDKDTLVGRGLIKLILPQSDGEDISYTDIRAADIGEHIAATSVCTSGDAKEHIAAASVSSD